MNRAPVPLEERCKKTMFRDRWFRERCKRRAVRDGWCATHHPDAVAERRARFELRLDASSALDAARVAVERIERRILDAVSAFGQVPARLIDRYQRALRRRERLRDKKGRTTELRSYKVRTARGGPRP